MRQVHVGEPLVEFPIVLHRNQIWLLPARDNFVVAGFLPGALRHAEQKYHFPCGHKKIPTDRDYISELTIILYFTTRGTLRRWHTLLP
jgi:hypothetical protein